MSTVDASFLDKTELAPVPVRRFTVEEYHQLGKTGVLSEEDRVELLEGWIVPKMNRNARHDLALELTLEALQKLKRPGWRFRPQMAITTLESEPEPDIALVRGAIRDLGERHPFPTEASRLVEIADSSLSQDRKLKQRIYARAQMPCYWIVNLIDMQLEVYTYPSGPGPAPSYLQSKTFRSNETVELIVDGEEWGTIRVADLLP